MEERRKLSYHNKLNRVVVELGESCLVCLSSSVLETSLIRSVMAGMVGTRNAYRIMLRKPVRKRSVGSQKRRWEDNIKLDFRKMCFEDGR